MSDARSIWPRKRSVYWRVAGLLVGVQVVTVLLAVWLSASLASRRSRDLAASAIRIRLDVTAEEIEARGFLDTDTLAVPPSLRLDLARRFPDPVYLISPTGMLVMPDSAVVTIPAEARTALDEGRVAVVYDGNASWGVAPFYSPLGDVAGGLYVRPLDDTFREELGTTRDAYVRALWIVSGVAVLMALLLGAWLTGQLVHPLRRITARIERIGAGEYGERLPVHRDDEIGRLSASINQMAAAVEGSVERLRETDRLRRELVANIGHDLRTPLAALLGYLEEAERLLGMERDIEAQARLDAAQGQGRYLSQLVGDLFELSVLDSSRFALRTEPVPLGELLREAGAAHAASFERDGIEFVVEVPEALPVLPADGVRLLRVLDNVLSNARRHTAPGGVVRLSAEATDNEVAVVIKDNGEGIDVDEHERVFERYYRGDDARTRQGKGTGLGLAIARAIARAHGGDLTVRSVRGEGSAFTLQLPVPAHEIGPAPDGDRPNA